MSITAIVPVKAQSERLEAKNLKLFNGVPLYVHKLKQMAGIFDKVVVSSEDYGIVDLAIQMGFEAHVRDPKYSAPDIPMPEVYKYITSDVTGDDIAWVNVTNPLVDHDILWCAVDDWKNTRLGKKDKMCDFDCLLSVYNLQKYVFWKGQPVNWIPSEHPRSQALGGLLAMSFAMNIRSRADIIRDGCMVGLKPYFFILDEITSTKIDYQWQFDLCEAEWKKRQS